MQNVLQIFKNGTKPKRKLKWEEKANGPMTNDKFQITNQI